MIAVFFISGLAIFWAMIGYPLSILFIGKFVKKENEFDGNYTPSVTIMVVAHNEEKVIHAKLENIISLDYPRNKIKFLVTSDNSTDDTNNIVKKFINKHIEYDITLYCTKNRGGKTSAQNEAQKLVNTDFIIFTDANAMLEKNSAKELMKCFSSEDVIYASGRLQYVNEFDTTTSASESDYWSSEIRVRDIESKIQTITAGNGALYAIRNKYYIDLQPIRSHDAGFPFYAASIGKRAISVPTAVAYEKAGENLSDEFKRKVRMNRGIIASMFRTLKALNVFKYRWFSYFYFGHRGLRSSLWLNHLLFLLTNIFLLKSSSFFILTLIIQIVFLIIAFLFQFNMLENSIARMINYYAMTIFAQYVGVYNTILGKNKPFWEKAESTR